jgi:predicted RNase H-like HicB family nuclease/predicted XRE-type DNA-binding protein
MVAQVSTYTVKAVRSEGWWGLTVPELPGVVSQVRSLTQAEAYVREAIAFVAGVPADSFAVKVVPELPGELAGKVRQAREASAEAEQVAATASALSRAAVALLGQAGLNGRETAIIMGLSKQRVSQLASGAAHRRKSTTSPRVAQRPTTTV